MLRFRGCFSEKERRKEAGVAYLYERMESVRVRERKYMCLNIFSVFAVRAFSGTSVYLEIYFSKCILYLCQSPLLYSIVHSIVDIQ